MMMMMMMIMMIVMVVLLVLVVVMVVWAVYDVGFDVSSGVGVIRAGMSVTRVVWVVVCMAMWRCGTVV